MPSSDGWHRATSTKHLPLNLSIDVNSMKWLEREAERTGLPVELVATTLLRKSCAEKTELNFARNA